MCGSEDLYINDDKQILIMCKHCGNAIVFAPKYTKKSALELYANRPEVHMEGISLLEKILFRTVAILAAAATVAMAIFAAKCSGTI